MFPVDVASRWAHIATAIVLVGGACFLKFVLRPAAEALPEAEHTSLKQRITDRWKFFVHLGSLVMLASGFYNYLAVQMPLHKGDKLYHALMGTKILLAFGLLFLSSALVGRAAVFAGFRKNMGLWLTVIVLLAATIVGISGFLKVRGVAPKPALSPVATAATTTGGSWVGPAVRTMTIQVV